MKITTSHSMIKPILRFFFFFFNHGVCSNNYFEYDTFIEYDNSFIV